MNEVFIIGEVVSKIEFNFIYKGKHISKASCYIKLKNKSKIEIIGYDEIADLMYRYLEQDNTVFVYGKIDSEGKVIARNVKKAYKHLTKQKNTI
ncbi:MAG: hypothetical protein J6A04_07295 [Clostridia bacterium]|nr:hypothetical protein [Clostridia bacterium]